MSEKNKTILFGKEFHIGTDDRTVRFPVLTTEYRKGIQTESKTNENVNL